MPHATGYDADYRGARFYKCDLQMGTPGDPQHWRGAPMGSSEVEQRAAAKAWVDRCYDVGLEVVAITDHNFVSQGFIRLVQHEIERQKSTRAYRLTLFPGFEIEADIGKGVHALALFSPERPLDEINHVLTECGVPPARTSKGVLAPSRSKLRDIIACVQRRNEVGDYEGVVILAHPTAESGAFNDDWVVPWLQSAEFQNPDLLAIELWKPPGALSTGFRSLLDNGPSCSPEWRRARPIGWVMSSDAKALTPEENKENFIGKRHSWIRMSRPSIMALRQAFLDRDSRIRFGSDRPDIVQPAHPFIRRIEVKNAAFLADQAFAFSRNLTTVIGGRGSGKSAMVEFLRAGLGQPPPAPANEEAFKQHRTLRGLLRTSPQTASDPPETVLRTTVERDGRTWVVESAGGAAPRVVSGDDVEQFSRFFPVRVYSQKELAGIAGSGSSLRGLLDENLGSQLGDLSRREEDLSREIRAIDEKLGDRSSLGERRQALETEAKDLKLRLDTIAQQAAPLQAWRLVAQEENFVQRIRDEEAQRVVSFGALVAEMTSMATAAPADIESWPHATVVKGIAARADMAVETLKKGIEDLLAVHVQTMKDVLHEAEEAKRWRSAVAAARAAADSARGELAAKGVDSSAFEAYDRLYREKAAQLLEVKAREAAALELLAKRDGRAAQAGRPAVVGLVSELRAVWHEQFEARRTEAAEINKRIPPTEKDTPFAQVEVTQQEDTTELEKAFDELPWARNVQTKDALREEVFKVAKAQRKPVGDVLRSWREAMLRKEKPADFPWQPADPKCQVFTRVVTEKVVEEFRLKRPADVVRIRLRRKSGDEVGLVPEAGSIGQKATAVLAVLLARGEEPLVIDQPEDDLDNAFLFHDLVPLLRNRKERRQLIIVTHNANIPVNGDAELVVALDGSSGRGTARLDKQNRVSIGALDRPEVVDAVSEILEGSEEAFRRRREKYGY